MSGERVPDPVAVASTPATTTAGPRVIGLELC